MKEPLGERASAMKQDKATSQRWSAMCTRQGKQVAPAAFTRHLVDTHEQCRYPPITPRCFVFPEDF